MTDAVSLSGTAGSGMARLIKALKELDGVYGQAGWFESAKYPDGTQVALVATIHEYGAPAKNIPPRMGLRAMIPEQQGSWARFAAFGAKRVLEGEGTATDAMEIIVSRAAADIRKQIASVTEPPLAPATIKARQARSASGEARTATGAKPLVDTGLMIATASGVVGQGTPPTQ